METNDILVTQKGWQGLDLSAAIDLNEEAEGYSRKVLLSYLDNLWDDRYIPIKLNDAFEAIMPVTVVTGGKGTQVRESTVQYGLVPHYPFPEILFFLV